MYMYIYIYVYNYIYIYIYRKFGIDAEGVDYHTPIGLSGQETLCKKML